MSKKERLIIANTKFDVNGQTVKFTIVHNLPDIPGLSYKDALQSWMYRCAKMEDFTASSFVRYIMSKKTGHIAMTIEDYERIIKIV